jgi:hypothetical protein
VAKWDSGNIGQFGKVRLGGGIISIKRRNGEEALGEVSIVRDGN